jgi:hypothetical protein
MKVVLSVALLLMAAIACHSEGFSWSTGAGVGVEPIWTFGKDPDTGNTGNNYWIR